jgi:hypothetical protein
MDKTDKTPVFQPVFADAWSALPTVFQKHYAHRSHSADAVALQGVMRFRASKLAGFLSPIMRLGGMLPMFNAKDIPATVRITSVQNARAVHFQREFTDRKGRPLTFTTVMAVQPSGHIIDWTWGGVGWLASFHYAEGRIEMRHQAYVWRFGKKHIRLPLERWLGECQAWEEAEGDNRFRMRMEMRRPDGTLFYGYEGIFDIAGVMRRDG